MSMTSTAGLVGLSRTTRRLRGPAISRSRRRSAGASDAAGHAPLRQEVAHELASCRRRATRWPAPRRPGFEHGEDAGGGGRHPGGEDDARLRALQRGQRLLQRAQGRVPVARVELEGEVRVAIEHPAHLGRGVEHERGGLHDGRGQRTLARPAVAVDGPRADAAARAAAAPASRRSQLDRLRSRLDGRRPRGLGHRAHHGLHEQPVGVAVARARAGRRSVARTSVAGSSEPSRSSGPSTRRSGRIT